jgi:tetratricopeptide (TPR) repeat protein
VSLLNVRVADQITNQQLDFDAVLKTAFARAILYGAAGRLDEAFDCLDQAIAYRDPALVQSSQERPFAALPIDRPMISPLRP